MKVLQHGTDCILFQNTIDLLFGPIDRNKNGFVEFDEFTDWYENYGMKNDTAKVNG